MKKTLKILIAIISVAAIGAVIYWQIHKKNIVKNTIESAVEKKTDSLYYIHYDSSSIDEINGNASFYNVTLQSDAAQKKLLESTDSLPNALYRISVAEITAKGIDIPGLLQNRNIAASEILLIKPVVQVINTGADKPKPFTYNDTLQLYEKILGHFTSIKSGSIKIQNGTVLITNKLGKALTSIEDINISLNNFLVDSTRDYNNLISYFIKDVNVSVSNIQLPESENKTRVNIGKLIYDAPKKILQIGEIQQYKTGDTKAIADLKNIVFNQLNTDAFIIHRQLKAGLVTCDGGLITIFKKEKKTAGNSEKTIEFSSDFIDAAQIEGLKTGNTTIVVKNPDKPGAEPFIINDVKCNVSNVKAVTSGSTLSTLINDASWEITAGGFSLFTAKNVYRLIASGLNLKSNGMLSVKQFLLKPQVSEDAFKQIYPYQQDRYDFAFNNLNITGINYKKLLASNIFEAETLRVQPQLKIFNDRTLPIDKNLTYKLYPHQSLIKMPFHFYIKTIIVKNGSVYYKERAATTGMIGIPNFTAINGTLDNVTNLPEKIKLNNKLRLNASSLFLGLGKLNTTWVLPLQSSDTVFTLKGEIGSMDGTALNQLTEPLGMVSLKSGSISKLNFYINGNNHTGTGKVIFLYNDLKLEVLKMKEDELKKKGLATLFANTLVKNDNPQNDNIREADIYHERDVKKSFFNLSWKCILSGVKNTVLGKEKK
jgi:hypothetical protein